MRLWDWVKKIARFEKKQCWIIQLVCNLHGQINMKWHILGSTSLQQKKQGIHSQTITKYCMAIICYHLSSASLSLTVLSTAWSFCFRLFTIWQKRVENVTKEKLKLQSVQVVQTLLVVILTALVSPFLSVNVLLTSSGCCRKRIRY